MSLVLAALLVSGQPLPFIDRSALRALAAREMARSLSSSAGDHGTVARLCTASVERNGAAASRAELGRSYSMLGPKVSILSEPCARRQSLRSGRIAAR